MTATYTLQKKSLNEIEMSATPKPERKDMLPYEPSPDAVDLTPDNDGGLLKEVKVPGTGTSRPGSQDRVFLHYTGYFPDGKVFDTSRDRRTRFEFTLGRGNVIKAWDIGVATMTKGEVATLYCRPEYAYGKDGNPPTIPPDATLVFEVELLEWKGEDLTKTNDGGISRQMLVKGSGYSSPKPGATVEIHVIGRHDGRVFEERKVTFILGEGIDHGLPEGVEIALEKFYKGERSVVTLASKYGFGEAGNRELGVPPNANVQYEITLERFEKGKESWEMDTAEKLEQATMFKTKGTEYFKAGNYPMAVKKYNMIVEYLEHEKTVDDKDSEKQCEDMTLAAHLNLALCFLKMEEFVDARNACDKALDMDPKNEKALFRRGQAYLGTNDFELSRKDFQGVLTLYPGNKAASAQLVLCANRIKAAGRKEKEIYGNMFAKFAARDEMREQERNKGQPDVLNNPGTWEGKHQQPQDNPLSNVEMLGSDNESLWP